MKKTITAYMVIYENDGTFETSQRLLLNEVEAKRSIHMFEGRNVAAIVPVTFDWDRDSAKCGMEFWADAKAAGEIPCRGAE